MGTSNFDTGPSSSMGRLSALGKVTAPVVSLDPSVRATATGFLTNVIKIDVEGAEAAVLDGAAGILRSTHPILFIALHGSAAKRDCLARLQSNGYQVDCLDAQTLDKASEILAY